MLISLEWLDEYVDIEGLKAEEISEALTMSGLEVEEIEKKGANFSNIKTAKIIALNPHPNADKLQLATVFNGVEEKTVVCGAKNIEVGQIIPYASIGSSVLDRKTGEQFRLKPAEIRGVKSEGMLCSADELGLDGYDASGILILNDITTELGEDLKTVLNIKEDTILHTAPTANRGDQMCIMGVAREVSALFSKEMKHPTLCHSELDSESIQLNSNFQVEIKDENTCSYYSIATLKNLKIKPSPDWIKQRLENSGVRSINNIVDITNYVMLEYNQPLHAFDLDKLQSDYLCVRYARDGEKITTLDEIERTLTKDSVLIATKDKGVALAGVMGDFSSEVDDNTKNIALEAAYFPQASSRKNAKSVGLRTEASARFERGTDLQTPVIAMKRAIELLEKYADAEFVGISKACSRHPEEHSDVRISKNNEIPTASPQNDISKIMLRFNQLKRILGIEIPADECVRISESLGFRIIEQTENEALIEVPSFRVEDVYREIDLIEEIARIYGYDKVPSILPTKALKPEIPQEEKHRAKIKNILKSGGFYEIVTSSLVGQPFLDKFNLKHDDENAVKLLNPQTVEHTMLRQDLIGSMLEVIKHNFTMGNKNLALYEFGKGYKKTQEATEKSSGVFEKNILAVAMTGDMPALSIWRDVKKTDFFSLKAMLENIFLELGISERIIFEAGDADFGFLHPQRTASIKLKAKGMPTVGFIGEVHPELLEKAKINDRVYLFEVDLSAILTEVKIADTKYQELPKYPSITRDIAFVIDEKIENQQIINAIKKGSSKLLEKVELFDIYQGGNIEQGKKSLAYRLSLLDKTATLTDKMADNETQKIKQSLEKTFESIGFREN